MMKKFSWAYVRAHPVMFGLIFLVFGLILWLVLNKGAGGSDGSGGDVVYQSAGVDPNQLAAQTAIAQSQIQANAQLQTGQLQLAALGLEGQNNLALANLSAQIALATLGSDERLGERSIAAQMEALKITTAADTKMQQDMLNFQYGYAKLTTDTTIALSAQQAEAYKLSSLLSIIPSLKKKNRDEALGQITGVAMGVPTSYTNSPYGTTISIPAYKTSPVMEILPTKGGSFITTSNPAI